MNNKLVTENNSFYKVLIIILLILILIPIYYIGFIFNGVSVNSNNYYVSTVGSDNWNGLYPTYQGGSNGPFKTVGKGMQTVRAGDTLYILEGRYIERVPPTYISGSAGNYITITNYMGGNVILDATGGNIDSLSASAIWISQMNYYRFLNLHFENSKTYLLAVELGDHIIISNCTFYNASASGIYCCHVSNITIDNNTINRCQTGYGYASGYGPNEGLTLLNCSNFEVCYNYIYNTSKLTIDAKSGSHTGSIHHNRINTTAPWVGGYPSAGPYIDAGATYCHNISIYNNVVWGNSTGYTIGGEQGGDCIDIKIYNNIYNGTGHAFQINSFPGDDLKINCAYLNNVVYGASVCFFISDINASYTNFTVRNNIFDGDVGFYLPGGLKLQYQHVDHNLYHVNSSDYYGDYSINSSPCFIDPNNGDFHLQSSSPAIDNGSSLYAPSVDFDGNIRPQGAGYDIGAYECVSSYYTNNFDTFIHNSKGHYWECTGANLQTAIDDLGDDGGTVWVGSDITLTSEIRLTYNDLMIDFQNNKVTLNSDISFVNVTDGVTNSGVRNVKIIPTSTATKSMIVLYLAPGSTWGKQLYNNLFENIYIVSSLKNHNYTVVHIKMDSGSYTSILSNTFRRIWAWYPKTLIKLECLSMNAWANGNTFDDMFVYGYEIGVSFYKVYNPDFLNGFHCNVFNNVKLQTASWSTDGFKNISGLANHFTQCIVWDWYGASSPNYAWSIDSDAERTYICDHWMPSGAHSIIDKGINTIIEPT